MNRWVRLHQNALHNPKIVSLSDRQYRAWTNLLLVAAAEDGMLPSTRDVACHLRMSAQDVELILSELVELDLIDMAVTNGVRTFKMHDWQEHQYISDTSTERVRKFRNKNKCNGDETFQKPLHDVSVTPPESYTDTEEDTLGLLSSKNRARGIEDQKVIKNIFGMKDDRKKEKLHRRAEGLGLDVEKLIEDCRLNKARNTPAYFTKLCVEHLTQKLPGIDENVIRAALWDKSDDAYTAVMQALLVAA